MTRVPREPALGFHRVRFARGGTLVLDGIDLIVKPGSVTALMGPSGCGKSTLLAIAAGLLSPASGDVVRHCRRMAMVFQDPLLLPWRTALDNVAFALKSQGMPRSERTDQARAALAAVGLQGEDIEKFPRQLSGGMRQRTALARALVVQPDLLLLDEPFGALDTRLVRQMYRLVSDYIEANGASALVVTHDAREAISIAERVAVMSPAPARVVMKEDLVGRSETDNEADAVAAIEAYLSDPEVAENPGD